MTSPLDLMKIIDAIPTAVLVIDARGLIVLVNAEAATLFGYPDAELRGESVGRLIPHAFERGSPAERARLVDNSETERQVMGGDFRGLHHNGTAFPIEICTNPLVTEDVPLLVCTIVDITARRRTEASLREKKTQLQVFIARAPVAMAMFDREMRYIAASRRWALDYGLDDRDLRGLSHYEIFPDLPERWRTVHRRALNGEVIAAKGDHFDRQNGTSQWLDWEVLPWLDESSIAGILIFTEDITQRKQAESLFIATIESAPIGMIMSDATGAIVLVNAETERLFGYSRRELLSRTVDMLVPQRYRARHPKQRKRFGTAPEARLMGPGRKLFGLRKDGSEFPVEIGLSPVETEAGQFVLSTIADITQREQLEVAKTKAEALAIHDFLTGLPNRVLLFDRITRALMMAKRKHRMVGILCLDVDDFKKVNDTYGHGVGDQLLVEIAGRMKNCLRESDTVTRLGGDEFLVLAPEVESVAQVEAIAKHLLDRVRIPFQLADLTLIATFSLGIALYPQNGMTPEALTAAADRALYVAKSLGKDRLAFADQEKPH